MIDFTETIQKLGMQGEKTGWLYLSVSTEIANLIKPATKKAFKVRGKIDDVSIKSIALLPMGRGNFIIPVNAPLRSQLKKGLGDSVLLSLEEDDDIEKLSEELLKAVATNADAYNYFNKLPPSHKMAYSTWLKSTKSPIIIGKRLAIIIETCAKSISYSDMMKINKEKKA